MKIRKKITLWISGAVLMSTIAFSSFIFCQLMEKPFTLIDRELTHMAFALIQEIELRGSGGTPDISHMPYNPDTYWILVTDNRENVLYRSMLTRFTDISVAGGRDRYLVEKNIPKSKIWLGQDAEDDVLFRVAVIHGKIGGHPVSVRIGKPVEDLEEELITLARDIGVSLLVCILVIFCTSWILAGRILRPVSAIIRKSREISDESLDQRIPLNRSRDELYELSVSLNTMFDRLQRSFDRQREFIGNASHELKSPITLLRLAQEEMLMNHQLSRPSTESLIKQLETTQRMSHLVKNLLDLSRMEQQEHLALGAVDLTELLAKVLDDYADVLAAKEIHVQRSLNDTCQILGDREKLFRLFVNLIDNAIRYNTDACGRITVTTDRIPSGIRVDIANTGRPIPEEDLPWLFEQFYRVEKSRSHARGGSGLGLAIALKIVHIHHGRISITNEAENEIRVTCEFPLKPKVQ